MAEGLIPRRWIYRAIFLALAALVGFARLLPLDPGPGGVPGPDVLLLLVCAWVVRRPEYAPLALVAAVFFLGDILLSRPLGLWAALVVVGTETLRARASAFQSASFLTEWFRVAAVVAAIHLADAAILALMMVDQPPLGTTLIRVIATIAVYPVVVVLTTRAIGLKRRRPSGGDRAGLPA